MISFILLLFTILNFITVFYYVALKDVTFVIPSVQTGATESYFVRGSKIFKKDTFF